MNDVTLMAAKKATAQMSYALLPDLMYAQRLPVLRPRSATQTPINILSRLAANYMKQQ